VTDGAGARLDRWLWAARFFRTRAQAKQAIEGGKVHVSGGRAKPSRMLKVGDGLNITRGDEVMDVTVLALSETRGGAPQARLLYTETAASVQRREQQREAHRFERSVYRAPANRPTKRDRRALARLKAGRGVDDSRRAARAVSGIEISELDVGGIEEEVERGDHE
jgi:ribosome-associated heat shock protein Hsp15